jgi:hypothetical protein
VAHWFNYTNVDMGNGRILADDLIIHAHQSQLDSWWLFKGSDVYGVLEQFRHDNYPGSSLPLYVREPASRARRSEAMRSEAGRGERKEGLVLRKEGLVVEAAMRARSC